MTMMSDREIRERKLVDALKTLTARISAAEFKQLTLIRELEDTINLPWDQRYASYIAWLCGVSVKTAHERIRVARALATLPCIAKLFEEGRISYSKVRVVTRVATPESDHKYASLALDGPVHFLEDLVRSHTQILDSTAQDQEHRRYLSVYTDEDGMIVVRARLAPEEGAIFQKALEAAKAAGAEDACLALTEVATAGVEKLATGESSSLHVETEEHICCVEGHACARTTAERLICQNPHRRTISDKQFRALLRIQGGCCAHPGCTNRRFLHGHHIVHWAKGGKTTLDNLVLICSKHHRWLHEGGYSVQRENDELVFRNHHGLVIERVPTPIVVEADQRDLADLSAVAADRYDSGEWYTNAENRDLSMQWLTSPHP